LWHCENIVFLTYIYFVVRKSRTVRANSNEIKLEVGQKQKVDEMKKIGLFVVSILAQRTVSPPLARICNPCVNGFSKL
jgi:hypothetical protein